MKHHFLFFIILLLSCEGKLNKSHLSHAPNQIIHKKSTWNWVDISEDDYREVALPIFKNPDIVTDDKPKVVERIQSWVNLFHELLSHDDPFVEKYIPKPLVELIDHNSANAFVGSVPLCLDIDIILPDSSRSISTGRAFSNIAYHAGEDRLIGFQSDCIPTTIEKFKGFLNSLNEKSEHCRMTLTQENQLMVGEGCSLDETIAKFSEAKRFTFFSVLNRMHIYTGLVKNYSEKSFVTILAHELAHYYRAHGTSFKGDFNYFYHEDAYDHLTKPVKDQSFELLFDQLKIASDSFHVQKSILPESPDFIFHPILFYSFGSVGLKSCSWSSNICTVSCESFSGYLSGWDVYEGLGEFPFKGDSSAVLNNISKLGKACLQSVAIEDGVDSSISFEKAKDFLTKPFWTPNISAYEVKEISEHLQKKMADFKIVSLGRDLNLWEFFLQMNDKLNKVYEQERKVLKIPMENRLGFYTTEQEADDLSIELLGKIGISSDVAIQSYYQLVMEVERDQSYQHRFPEITSMEVCEAMLRTQVIEHVDVSFGDVHDEHHNPCYRYLNVNTEIRSHDYQTNSHVELPEFSVDWRSIQQYL